MNETPSQPQWQTISVPLAEFSARLTAVAEGSGHASVHSRLALIHQTAKAYATEAARQGGCAAPVIDVDELTNPPLFDLPVDPDDMQQVLIRFSYQPGPTY